MRYCPNCGREWPDDAVFCAECGTKLETAETSPEPETPEQPEASDTPAAPEPEVAQTPAAPEPEAPEPPTAAEPEASAATAEPEAPEATAIPEAEVSEAAVTPVALEPEVSAAAPEPEAPEAAVAPTAPEPEAPEAAATSETEAEVPQTPEVSEAPAAPVAPEQAEAPETENISEQPQAPETTPVTQQPQAPAQPVQDDTTGKKKGRGRLIGLIVAIVVVVVAIVVILVAVFSCSNSNVTDEQIEQDFKDSSVLSDGIMQSSYVEDSAYELLDFEVIEQSVESADMLGLDGNMLVVSFAGSMENESFETEFDGHVFYVNDEGTWTEYLSSGFMIDDATTTPLKGVDYFDFSGTSSDNSTVGEFSSTLEQSNGEYISVASQDISYDYWFATDTATYTETFVFENDMGWWPSDDAEISNTSTNWTLAGKTFEPLENISLYYGGGLLDSTLSFTDIDSNGTVTADYTISYIPASGDAVEGDESDTYYDVTLEGTVSGVAQHDFGWESFSFELNDPENGVTFTCSDGSETMIPGSGTVPTLWVSLVTNTVYYRYSFGDNNSEDYTIEFYNVTFAENTAA